MINDASVIDDLVNDKKELEKVFINDSRTHSVLALMTNFFNGEVTTLI